MTPPMITPGGSDNFYGGIPVFRGFARLMEPQLYSPLPDDWAIGVADIVDSTKAIAARRYKAVNMAGAAVIGALLVITRRNAVHSAFALILTLLSVAGLYLMLYAPFVAGVQIIVYAGGIMVLFLFVIMLVNLERVIRERQFNRMWPVGLLASCALLALFVGAFVKGKSLFPDRLVQLPEASNTQGIAMALYGDAGRMGPYTFAFEIASILLLVAILGAVIMTKKRI